MHRISTRVVEANQLLLSGRLSLLVYEFAHLHEVVCELPSEVMFWMCGHKYVAFRIHQSEMPVRVETWTSEWHRNPKEPVFISRAGFSTFATRHREPFC
jgi:hypothetical protein